MNSMNPMFQYIYRNAVLALAGWSVVAAASLAWNMTTARQQSMEMARNEAVADINKDIAFRSWATSHGGVYVTPSEKTPPNPYLTYIPDRDLVTTSGKKLTLMNPAYMLREMQSQFPSSKDKTDRITSLKPLNPANAPDAWEAQALRRFETGEKEVWEITEIGKVPSLRMMRPFLVEKGCLKCHAQQGYKVGDVRGGIDVSISLTPFIAAANHTVRNAAISHGVIWLLGLTVIGFFTRRGIRREKERWKAQQDLQDSEEKFSQISNTAQDAILMMDDSEKISYWNPAAEKLFGYRAEEAIGQELHRLIVPQRFYEAFQRGFSAYLQSGKGPVIGKAQEVAALKKGGSEFPVELTISSTLLGGRRYAIGILRDITERRLAEESLRDSEARTRILLESTAESIYGVDTQGRCIFVNNACLRLLGFQDEAEMLGQPIHGLIHHTRPDGSRYPAEDCPLQGAYRSGQKIHGDDQVFWRCDGSSFPVEYWSHPLLRNDEIMGAVVTFFDITERRRDEESLRQLNENLAQQVTEEVRKNREKDLLLIQQSRHAAMGEMTHNIAHQWRQPLNTVTLILANILDAYKFGELNEEILNQAVADGNRVIQKMSRTIDDFRHFFQPNEEKTPFKIVEAVREAIAMVDASFRDRNIEFKIEGESGIEVLGYENECAQVLLNLLNNAKEAIMASGAKNGCITIRLEQDGGLAKVIIRDNGGGIPPGVMGRIFDPYFSTKETGTGIGLYMAKMVIEKNMGGQIAAANIEGGAEFTVSCPLLKR